MRRRARIFLAGFMLLAAQSCVAQPFLRPYTLSLGHLAPSGDLNFTLRLGRIELGGDASFEISLEHKMTKTDYGLARSVFVVQPLRTSLTQSGPSSWLWKAPGGETATLHHRPADRPESQRREVVAASVFQSDLPVREFFDAEVSMWTGASGRRQLINDQGWTFDYENGLLRKLFSPGGGVFSVETSGAGVDRIFTAHQSMLRVECDARGELTRIIAGSNDLRLMRDDQEGLKAVTDGTGRVLARFAYDEAHLVARIELEGASGVGVSWRKNPGSDRGDTDYELPYSLASFGAERYQYAKDGQCIILSERNGGVDGECLRLGYGGEGIRWAHVVSKPNELSRWLGF